MAAATELVGRDQELATIELAARRALTGSPAAVLVCGEAGIGKSTLVRAATERIRLLGIGVGVGTCLDVSAPRLHGPVLDALRQLGSPTSTRDLHALLHAVADRAGEGAVMLVVEDLHWADAGTRDVVRILAHTAEGPLALLLTVRIDDLPRQHPARDLVRDVTRSSRCTRIELGPLDEGALRQLATLRLGVAADDVLAARLRRRSAGNPLYAEQLLDAGLTADSGALPPRLADLFLARVERLSDQAAAVLRAASVTGTRVDEALVTTMTRLTPAQVTSALREARDQHLVVVSDERLHFHHALLRDALYHDLLPAERAELHARVVAELTERSRVSDPADMSLLGALAYHAECAGDTATALRAYVEAGRLWRTHGPGRGAEHLMRALDLWDQVTDPVRVTGTSHADLLRMAGRAAGRHGDTEKARSLVCAAVEEAEAGDDRLMLSRAYTAYAESIMYTDGAARHALLAAEAAGPAPSAERAEALTLLGLVNRLQGRPDVVQRCAQQVLSIGAASGDLGQQAWGHALAGLASMEQGYVRRGAAQLRRAIAEASEAGRLAESLRIEDQLAWTMALSGPSAPALEVAEDAARRARRLRLPGDEDMALEQEAQTRVWRGELDAAADVLERMRRTGLWIHRLGIVAFDLQLARGDLEGATAVLHEMRQQARFNALMPDADSFFVGVRTELFLAKDDVAAAARNAEIGLTAVATSDSPWRRAFAVGCAYVVLRVMAGQGMSLPPGLLESARRTLEECSALPEERRSEWTLSLPAAYLHVAHAVQGALDGNPRLDLWRRAVNILESTEYHLWRIRIQVHLADELAGTGNRAAAQGLIHDTWHEAAEMGAGAVAASAAALARRRHMSVPEQRLPASETVLTPREREVLALIENGASNRGIAETLVISEKTVSVHVSHLLAKLGASRRGEAAAMARRLRG